MSRIGIVEEDSSGKSEQRISPMRDRATILEAMGGRKNAAPLFVASGVILLVFIAGAVMLGIGIGKAVSNASSSCDTDSSATTTKAPTTIMASKMFEEDSDIIPVPFFVNLQNANITSKDLTNNFGSSVSKFRDQVINVLNDDSIVTVLSVIASPTTPKIAVFLDDVAVPTIGLVGIAYTSKSQMTAEKLKTKLNVPGFSIDQIGDQKDQLCLAINPITGDTNFTPCQKRIVFALDYSGDIKPTFYSKQVTFLNEYVFAGNWNHLERLGIAWFSNRAKGDPFNYYYDNSTRGLEFLRSKIATQKQTGSPRSLRRLFDQASVQYQPGNDFDSVNYIFFISGISEVEANNLISPANKLKQHGNLTFILLGNDADPEQEQSKKLTDHIIVWKDPQTTSTPDDWNYQMWTVAYGCDSGDVPQTVPTPPTPSMLPTTASTSTLPPSIPSPCSGAFLIGLDTSSSMSSIKFSHQRDFVGNKLFTPDYFNHYERLSILYYTKNGPPHVNFGYFSNLDDVKEYVGAIQQRKDNASLRRFITSIVNQNIPNEMPNDAVTVATFVSSLTKDQANKTMDVADRLQKQGVRLVLIGLGDVDPNVMKMVTDNVFQWDAQTLPEPNNYRQLFRQIFNCPDSSLEDWGHSKIGVGIGQTEFEHISPF